MLRNINLFQCAVASNNPVHRQRIKELVGKNTAGEILRKVVNPDDIVIAQQFLLVAPHRGAALKNHVREPVALQNIACEQSFACAQLYNGERVEGCGPLLKLFGEELSENRVDIGRSIKVTVRANGTAFRGVVKTKDLFHIIPEWKRSFFLDTFSKLLDDIFQLNLHS